ncbi:transposase [Streptomyces sp. NPDC020377]|uniref:transposase n=1 Tax=Streptomyces sp. NPDC020377 TaxID=3365070 RepID=UPI0037A61449
MTGGQAGDVPGFMDVMAGLRVPRRRGRPRTRPDVVMADKGYSSRAIRDHLSKRGIRAVIPVPADQRGHRLRRGAGAGDRRRSTARHASRRNTVERPSGCASTPRHPGGPPRNGRPGCGSTWAARGSTARSPPARRPALRPRRPLPVPARGGPPPGPLVPVRPRDGPPPDSLPLALLRHRHRGSRRTARATHRPAGLPPPGAASQLVTPLRGARRGGSGRRRRPRRPAPGARPPVPTAGRRPIP